MKSIASPGFFIYRAAQQFLKQNQKNLLQYCNSTHYKISFAIEPSAETI
jgi:hypothetical protein